MASYLIKWSNGEKRQEEEAEVVAATQKRKMICKTRRANWASEASPTLGCSIEISRDIICRYVGVCLSYVKLTA